MERIEKPWGYEIIWAKTDKYVGKILHINKGQRLSLQYHNVKDETIMVLSGELILTYGNNWDDMLSRIYCSGEPFHIPAKLIHRMEGQTDCDVLEVSTPELADVVRMQDDYKRI